MKKMFLVITMFISLLLATAIPALADTKVGVVNMQELLQKLPQMTQIADNLKKQFSDKQKQQTEAQTIFKKDAENFKRDSAVMSDKDKQASEDKLFKQQQDLQKQQVELQRDYLAAQNKEVEALIAKVKDEVKKLAEKNGFNLVLMTGASVYADPNLDLTAKVLELMK